MLGQWLEKLPRILRWQIFIGIDGFDEKRGFTCNDFARRDTCRMLAQSAKELVILTDSSKFDTQGMVSEFNLDEVDCIYTDSGLTAKSKIILKNMLKTWS